jgi:orotate phosphoribosyltransferase
MLAHQRRFLDLALSRRVLRFGEFTLKSGRLSPYFFNAGLFDSGAALATLGECYAETLIATGLAFDKLFGPAYKGIPLATSLASEFSRRGRDLPVAFNRKEAKAHGEGGMLIGASRAERREMIDDDVITAGTAIRAALGLIQAGGGSVAGIVVALDRQEILGEAGGAPETRRSAAQAVAVETGVPVIAVANLHDLLAFAGESAELVTHRDRLLAYRASYGSGSSN